MFWACKADTMRTKTKSNRFFFMVFYTLLLSQKYLKVILSKYFLLLSRVLTILLKIPYRIVGNETTIVYFKFVVMKMPIIELFIINTNYPTDGMFVRI